MNWRSDWHFCWLLFDGLTPHFFTELRNSLSRLLFRHWHTMQQLPPANDFGATWSFLESGLDQIMNRLEEGLDRTRYSLLYRWASSLPVTLDATCTFLWLQLYSIVNWYCLLVPYITTAHAAHLHSRLLPLVLVLWTNEVRFYITFRYSTVLIYVSF